MKDDTNFSNWLDAQLRHLAISAKELAKQAQVSEATISRIRNGRIPLSPRLKSRLSQVLKTKIQDIPDVKRSESMSLTKLLTMQHATPDYALINYALHEGMFLDCGIDLEELTDQDVGVRHTVDYFEAIKVFLGKGCSVLAIGPKPEFIANALEPICSIPSHSYCGYHLISRACANLPTFEDAPIHQRIFTLKMLLEQLENTGIWHNNYDRISWQSSIDYAFLQLLERLSAEFMGLEGSFSDSVEKKFSNKAGLDSLHAVGSQGADLVLAGCGMLAEAYSQPNKYKVLMSLDRITKAISALTVDASPALLASFSSLYPADTARESLERFKTIWLERLAAVEKPIFWHLFCPKGIGNSSREALINGVAAVQRALQQALSASNSRDVILRAVQAYSDARSYRAHGNPSQESFRLAWNHSFKGI